MSELFKDKHILLGVTGSIACYKSVDLASKLTQAGALVEVVMTQAAEKFVAPITFQTVTGRKVYGDSALWGADEHVLHIQLAEDADLILIAPATANTIAKLANGFADNLLTLIVLASSCPLLIAPAMDGNMYHHPSTQANLDVLKERDIAVLGPASGHLASGIKGEGRMLEPIELFQRLQYLLSRNGPLQGKHVLVTAGGTQEPIDPVRFITNRSSSKQGYALSQAALDMGADVTLITAPTCLSPPFGATVLRVHTAKEMHDAVMRNIDRADILIMAAAVADFKPVNQSGAKLKKKEGVPEIKLEPTIDILQSVAKRKAEKNLSIFVVGFAAETEDLEASAFDKLSQKKLDMIVANDVSAEDAGFQVDTNRVSILFPDGSVERVDLMTKMEISRLILEKIVQIHFGI